MSEPAVRALADRDVRLIAISPQGARDGSLSMQEVK